MSKERNYGVDLLRLVLMFMVCMLHTLSQGGVLDACEAGSAKYKIYWFFEIFSYCAVDAFAIISGYMAVDKPRKYEKLVDMWFQAFFYSFVITLILTAVGVNQSWDVKELIKCALPVSYKKFWYFTAYFVLFLAMPILNKFLFQIDEVTAKRALIVFVVLFLFFGLLDDAFITRWGISTIWVIVLYCIGALAKKAKLFEERKSITLIILWAACVLVTWVLRAFFTFGRFTNYVSPTVVLSGMIMVVLFSRIRIKGTVVSKLSPLAFGIYLFQLNQVIWGVILKKAFVFVAEKNIITGVLCVFGLASLIFASGLIVEYIRTQLARLLRISSLSRKIVEFTDKNINKLFVFLK